MKRIAGVVVCAVALVMAAGCAKTRIASEKNPFDIMQEKFDAITAAGGLAAIGEGVSRTVHLAIDKANRRGRTKLETIMTNKVESLKKDFSEEVGAVDNPELDELFSAVTKQVMSQAISRAVPNDMQSDTKNGMTTAWALMVVDPGVIADAFASQANTARHLYTRFRASQAFADLDAEVKAFDEFKQKNAGMMLGE